MTNICGGGYWMPAYAGMTSQKLSAWRVTLP
jgi:hypothetical protein